MRYQSLLGMVVAVMLVACVVIAHAAEPVDPGLVLTALREELRKQPTAERVRVTIKRPGKVSRNDEFIAKVDPGKQPDRSDAAVWLELGDLRVYASGGRLIAVHTGDVSSYYEASYTGPLTPQTLRRLLPPLPAPLVSLALSPDDPESPAVSEGLTAYTPRVRWKSAEASGTPPAEVVVMTGEREPFPGEHPPADETKVTMTIDARTSRAVRMTAVLPDAADLRLDIEPIVAGNPAAWAIRTKGRTRVAALTDLHARRGDAAAAQVVPEMAFLDSSWTSWDHRSVFRAKPGTTLPKPTHLALVFVRETATDPFGVPTADSRAADEELQRIEHDLAGANASAVRLVHYVIPVMLKMDDASRRKVETATKVREGVAGEGGGGAGVVPPGGNMIWAPSAERTIDRFAPDASCAVVIIRADNSLAGIVVADRMASDRRALQESLRATLAPAKGAGASP